MTSTQPIEVLPELIRSYLTAHQARETDRAIRLFAPDASVVDEGRTYRGHDEIREWLQRSASEYTYTIELTGAQEIDDRHYIAVHHLEGDFPGGVVDLRFQFTLVDGLISALTIEP